MTPEGKVKAAVKRELDRYPHYREMPVPTGYGLSGVDFVVCMYGLYIAIETKAPGKAPTKRQLIRLRDIERAGGLALVVGSVDDATGPLRILLHRIRDTKPWGEDFHALGLRPDYSPLDQETDSAPRPRKRKA